MIPVDWAQGFKRVLLDNPRFMTQGQMMFPILRQTRILGIHLGFNKSQYIVTDNHLERNFFPFFFRT